MAPNWRRFLAAKCWRLDISQEKLDQLEQVGIDQTLNISGMEVRNIKKNCEGKMPGNGSPFKPLENL